MNISAQVVRYVTRSGAVYYSKERPFTLEDACALVERQGWVKTTAGLLRTSEIVALEPGFANLAVFADELKQAGKLGEGKVTE